MRGLFSILVFLGLMVQTSTASELSTNEVYALMRDALHPTIRARLDDPEQLQMTLDWIVHVSLPNVTNDTAFFDSYKTPVPLSTPRIAPAPQLASLGGYSTSYLHLLTNRAARLSIVPPIPRLSLVFDDGKQDSVSRAIPGVDYPGIAPEDAGSTPHNIRIALCAPKNQRRFKVLAEIPCSRSAGYEFKWMVVCGAVQLSAWTHYQPDVHSHVHLMRVDTSKVDEKHPARVVVFAREKGRFWGPPGIIEFRPDGFGQKRAYVGSQLFSVDYGTFKDTYRYDEKDRILGFTRTLPGMVRGEEYSCRGERIIDGYSDDRPKTTCKVRYFTENDELLFTNLEEKFYHPNVEPEDRAAKW